MAGEKRQQDGKSTVAAENRAGLVSRYREPLVRYFQRRGLNAASAEDMAHDTFVRLFALKGADHVENTEAYLFQIASSVLNDHLRKAQVRRRYALDLQEDAPNNTEVRSPARVLEGKEALTRLEAALSELKPKTREIFLLSRMEGLTYTQIAVRFGVTASAVEKHVAQAIIHLVHRLRNIR